MIGTSYSIYRPTRFKQALFDPVARWAASQNRGTILALPMTLAMVSITGKAYVTDPPDAPNRLIYLPSWVGRKTLIDSFGPGDQWVEGYVYSSRPLIAGTDDSFYMLNVPDFCSPWQVKSDRGSQQIQIWIYVDHPISHGWYAADSFS